MRYLKPLVVLHAPNPSSSQLISVGYGKTIQLTRSQDKK
jgi:hypothetical protein